MKLTHLTVARTVALSAFACIGATTSANAAYLQTDLVANNPDYNPQILDPFLQSSRSIAIRPATSGFGGHFWINNLSNGTNTVYVGDVGGVSIFQDSLTVVTLPSSPNNPSPISSPTGQVFNGSKDFVITLPHPNGAITAPSKFLFASLDGTISAWTDRKQSNGTPDWPLDSAIVVDRFGDSAYQGVTVSDRPANNRLYAADFGIGREIEVFDSTFAEITSVFDFSNPFANEGYAPYNIQTFAGSLYVTYAKPSAEQPGEGEVGSGLGKLAQFDFDGNLLNTWDDGGLLNVPAGIAIAPANFGKFSNALLVANFGDGTIVGFDINTRQTLGHLRDGRGKLVVIPGIWGLTFGNGKSLGELNHLYFAADPEKDTNESNS
jgi:uncharacterized protein (TIGR03118 family)